MISKICIFIYVALFDIGRGIHLLDIVQSGWMPYNYAPDWMNLYWTSLVFFDFAVIGFLLFYRKVGLIISLLIMLSDVWINAIAINIFNLNVHWGVVVQTVFLGFIIGSIGFLWEPPNDNVEY